MSELVLNLVKSDKGKNEYYSVINNYTTAASYQTPVGDNVPFVGSQPEQLSKLNYQYVSDPGMLVTPKLDGVRYLISITPSGILFINRAGETFEMGGVGVSKRRVDGYYLLDAEVMKGSIFVFDILFMKNYKGGIEKMYKLPFHVRYEALLAEYTNKTMLHSIVYELNVNFGITLSIAIYTPKILLANKTYEQYTSEYSRNYPLVGDMKYDGVIFVNPEYRYYLFPRLGYGKYKWKPKSDLTVDLLFRDGRLYDKRGNEWDRINNVEDEHALEDGNTYEFKIDKIEDKKYVNLSPLLDKGPREKGANSILTLEGVYGAYVNFIEFGGIMGMFYNPLVNSTLAKGDLSFLNRKSAMQIALLYNDKYNFKFIDDEESLGIYVSMIDIYKKYVEYMEFDQGISFETKKIIKYYDSDIGIEKQKSVMEKLRSDSDSDNGDDDEGNYETEEDKLVRLFEGSSVFRFKTRSEYTKFRMFVDFQKTYEKIGDRINRKKINEEKIRLIERDVGLKNRDTIRLKTYLDRMLVRYATEKEVEYVAKFKVRDRINTFIVETFKYKYDKTKLGLDKYKFVSYTSDRIKNSVVGLKGVCKIFDYNINCNFVIEHSENIKSQNKDILYDPSKLSNIQKRKLLTTYSYFFNENIKINLITVKEFSKKPERDEEGEVIINPRTGKPNMIERKSPIRKSYIEIEYDFKKLMERKGKPYKDYKIAKIKGKNVEKYDNLEFTTTNIEEFVKLKLNIAIRFLVSLICT